VFRDGSWNARVAPVADIDTLVTKAPAVQAPPLPATCTSIQDFFLTACQLSWYGVRFYGTIDVGFGYQTHGAPWNPNFTPGASYYRQKMNRSAMWTLAPNGLSQSNVGIQIKEPLAAGWSFVGQLEGRFDPYSLRFANSPGSEFNNVGVPVNQQSTNGDSSRAGQFYNSLGFLGVSSDSLWGRDRLPAQRTHARRRSCLRSDGGFICLLAARIPGGLEVVASPRTLSTPLR
jgi:hypothetical protein